MVLAFNSSQFLMGFKVRAKCEIFIFRRLFVIFIPGREMRSISTRGPIVFTYVLFWARKGLLEHQNIAIEEAFLKRRQCSILWTDGLMVIKSVLFFNFEIY